MSKRGSKLAKSFSAKDWSLKIPKKRMSEEEKEAHEKKISSGGHLRRKKRKAERLENRWKVICEKFGIDPDEDTDAKKVFFKIKSNTKELQALQKIKTFKIYCKYYKEEFTIENYFLTKKYLIDYKKDHPDVYFFNVIARNKI